jgi:hypothetical protein
VWEACSALEKLPRDNLAATRALLAREELLLTDALQEIEEVSWILLWIIFFILLKYNTKISLITFVGSEVFSAF